MCFLQKRLGREAKGFVGGQDADFDDFCLAALFSVGYVRHWGEGTDLDGNRNGVRSLGRFGMQNFVALHRTVVALGSPVGEKVLHRVAWAGFPELISPGSVTGGQRLEEALCGLFLRVIAEREPQRHNRDQRKRRERESHSSRFIWFTGRGIAKGHSVFSCPANVGIRLGAWERHPSPAE